MTKLVVALITFSFSFASVCAKPWRNITPLHSTKSDVERVLGKPSQTSNHWSTYQTKTEAVSVLYSNGLPCGSGANSEWQVPKGTVVSITVALKSIVLFSALNVDESKFQKRKDPHMLNAIEYLDMGEGESISVVNGEVSTFEYFGTAADAHLRCSKVPVSQEPITEPTYRLDVYGKLKRKDEEIRLDNLAITLTQRPSVRGYILVYAGENMSAPRARALAKRARNYLVNVRNIESERVVALYGGKREEFTTELYIVPKCGKAPSPFARQ